MKDKQINCFMLAAMFLSVGMVLPFFTGQIPQVGKLLLPMHIPVFLCGLVCGWKYGLVIGFLMPLFRSVLFGMPILFPTAFAMAFELMTYGFCIGFLYEKSRWKCIKALYRCMLMTMLAGRLVYGIVEILILGVGNGGFTIKAYLMSTFVYAVPGIIAQLIIVPAIMLALNKTGLVKMHGFHKKEVRHHVKEG